jgi:hypothetical protein
MNLKGSVLNIIAEHPRAITYGIGLAIAAIVGIGLGTTDGHQASASPAPIDCLRYNC